MKTRLRLYFTTFLFLLSINFSLVEGKEISYANSNNHLSFQQEISESPFNLYVNDGILIIRYNHSGDLIGCEVSVFNILGQEILHKKLDNSVTNQLSLPLKNTCYIIRITYSGNVYTKKIIVTE